MPNFKSFRESACLKFKILFLILLASDPFLVAQEAFRVLPYVQNPDTNAISILWLSEQNNVGKLSVQNFNGDTIFSAFSSPVLAASLAYPDWEVTNFFDGSSPSAPYQHRLRVPNLTPHTTYQYSVIQEIDTFRSAFRTAALATDTVKFILMADSETEPESHGKFANWEEPGTGTTRDYLVDQNVGIRNNLSVIKNSEPDLLWVAGDLVESGGEQRDWDEFWSVFVNDTMIGNVASKIPVMAALGNHDYFEGPSMGAYNQPGSERAVSKYLTYFEFPENGASNPAHEERYYSFRYASAYFIVLDVSNNGVNGSDDDTNFYLLGSMDSDGGEAPGFSEGEEQYAWLQNELEQSQKTSPFTFIVLHHVPYSSGPHGLLPGTTTGFDKQSGVPVRSLTPLFMEFGVDAVFAGHDEMYERSLLDGLEHTPKGEWVNHEIHFYDLGIAGDGLRGPVEGTNNTWQQFLADTDAPEVWNGDTLISGGKHYGHLEVNIVPKGDNLWEANFLPVYIFPLLDTLTGLYTNFERRIYDDEISLQGFLPDTVAAGVVVNSPEVIAHDIKLWPNPFNDAVHLTNMSGEKIQRVFITDVMGREVASPSPTLQNSGVFIWSPGESVLSLKGGMYLFTIALTDGSLRKIPAMYLK